MPHVFRAYLAISTIEVFLTGSKPENSSNMFKQRYKNFFPLEVCHYVNNYYGKLQVILSKGLLVSYLSAEIRRILCIVSGKTVQAIHRHSSAVQV